jgi:hypothetical protein
MSALAYQDTSSVCVIDPASGELTLVHDGSPPEVMRARILHLTRQMLETGENLEMRTEHELADGLYIRRLYIPKGTVLAGKIHKKACFNSVESGDITVLTEFGCRRLKPGFTGVSRAGIQKIGLAHEDTVFVNVFRTDETDLAKIEEEIAGVDDVTEDRADYALFLRQYGLTEEFVRRVSEDWSDHIEIGGYDIECRPSSIEGEGMFATRDFSMDELVAPARIGVKRTIVGRKTNHAKNPNCKFHRTQEGHLLMHALRDIAAGEELTINYRQAAQENPEAGLGEVCLSDG